MRTKFISSFVAVVGVVGLVAGPVQAQEGDVESEDDAVAQEVTEEVVVDEDDLDDEEREEETELENDGEVELDDDDEDDDEGEDGEGDIDEVIAAAGDAQEAAEDLEDGTADEELESKNEAAREALQATVDRLSEEGAGGEGVAAEVLTRLIAGESPAGIGAEHGAEMREAAAERRAERLEARQAARAERQEARESAKSNRSEDAGRPDHAGRGK